MAQQSIEIGAQTPIAAVSALKKSGYNVTTGGKPVSVSETDDININTKERDYDKIRNILKKYGWGDDVVNDNTFFEESDEFNNAGGDKLNDEQYAKVMHKWLYNISIGESQDTRYDKELYETSKENQTILDVFPELNQQVPEDGGEVKDIKPITPKLKKITIPKEVETNEGTGAAGGASTGAFVGPFFKKENEMKETNKPNIIKKTNVMEKGNFLLSKKEVLEVINAEPGTKPSTTPSPTTTPTTTPSKPAQRPDRKNPFKPKHNPKPKAGLPGFLSSDSLKIGLNENVDLTHGMYDQFFGLNKFGKEDKEYFESVFNLLLDRTELKEMFPNLSFSMLYNRIQNSMGKNKLWDELSIARQKNQNPVKMANAIFNFITKK